MRKLKAQLAGALSSLDKRDTEIVALIAAAKPTEATGPFVQNVSSKAAHNVLPEDPTRSTCGCYVASARIKKGGLAWLTNLDGVPWKTICERCRPWERQAAHVLLDASDTEFD